MKELLLSITINDFTAQDYYTAIYATPDTFKRYHNEHTNDPKASVSAWSSGSRTVQFNLALNVPQMLKKLIGTDSIAVLETQEITWQGKEKFVVSSVPSLNFPGSAKFTTKGHTTVTTVGGRTCQVDAVIICSAAMPWPMQGTVEAAMASEAQAGVTKFQNYVKKVCEASRAAPQQQQQQQPVAPATPSPAEVQPLASGEEEYEDLFYDAWDVVDEGQQEALNNRAGSMVAGASSGQLGRRPGMQVGRPVQQGMAGGGGSSAHEVLILASLRELQLSNHATAQALAEVTAQLKHLNESVAAIQAAVAGAGGARGRGGYTSYYGTMLMVVAGASTAAVLYMRSRQRAAQ